MAQILKAHVYIACIGIYNKSKVSKGIMVIQNTTAGTRPPCLNSIVALYLPADFSFIFFSSSTVHRTNLCTVV